MTREDLSPAQQAVQSAHAAIEYAAKHPEVAGCILVMLTVDDEHSLYWTACKLELFDVDVERFREPDMGNALTAIATSDPIAGRKLRKLPLMLRGGEEGGREHVVAASEGSGAAKRE